MDEEPKTYAVPEVARLLGISRAHAYELIRIGRVPAIRLGRRVVCPSKVAGRVSRQRYDRVRRDVIAKRGSRLARRRAGRARSCYSAAPADADPGTVGTLLAAAREHVSVTRADPVGAPQPRGPAPDGRPTAVAAGEHRSCRRPSGNTRAAGADSVAPCGRAKWREHLRAVQRAEGRCFRSVLGHDFANLVLKRLLATDWLEAQDADDPRKESRYVLTARAKRNLYLD